MTLHRAINWAIVAAIIALYALMAHLDGPSDHHTEMAQAQDLQDAINSEAAQARFVRAAGQLCVNSGWKIQPDGSVVCVPRKVRGPGTVITAAVQP